MIPFTVCVNGIRTDAEQTQQNYLYFTTSFKNQETLRLSNTSAHLAIFAAAEDVFVRVVEAAVQPVLPVDVAGVF